MSKLYRIITTRQALIAGALLSSTCLFNNAAFAGPKMIDLRADQTEIKDQGNRRSCITFSSTAAIEAAYKRAGYGDLDLSEEFFQYMNKVFWLYSWPDQRGLQAADRESQIGFQAGGSGTDYLGPASNGFRIPDETVWKYKLNDYNSSDYSAISIDYTEPFWSSQKARSDFNLDAEFLMKEHLTADKYYSGTGFNRINTSNKTSMVSDIEDQLAAQREVVIDMQMKYNISNSNNPLTRRLEKCNVCTWNGGGHSMLIVGYNRESTDPRQHYFIVKNSWGKEHGTARTNGFTYLSYSMLMANAYGAAYITGVTNPEPWPELANVGRWETNLDGWRGTLDIYRVPGFMKQPFERRGITMRDDRIGTFYKSDGRAYRVNGVMNGRELTFWIDENRPHLPYDRLQGTKYVMNRIHGDDLIVGRYSNPANGTYAGYMKRKNSWAFVEPPIKRNANPRDMVGRWSMTYGTSAARTVRFCISSVQSNGAIRGQGSYQINGSFYPGEGGRHFRIQGINNNNGYVDARRMSWHANIVTGTSYWNHGRARGGVIMKKLSDRCV